MLENTFAEGDIVYGGIFGNISLSVWRERPNAAGVGRVIQTLSALQQRHATYSFLTIIEDSAGLPTPDGREMVMDVARRNGTFPGCYGLLLPANSEVTAMMLRAFVRTLRTATRSQLTTVVESDPRTFVTTFANTHQARTGAVVQPEELLSAMTTLRSRSSR